MDTDDFGHDRIFHILIDKAYREPRPPNLHAIGDRSEPLHQVYESASPTWLLHRYPLVFNVPLPRIDA